MSLEILVGATATVLAAVVAVILTHRLRERSEDRREGAPREAEGREAEARVLSEVERNRTARIELVERISGIGLIPRDAHEALREDAWNEEGGRLSQLMPRQDFEQLRAYHRERERFAQALRDYHRPEHTKNDRPRLQEELLRLAEGLEGAERQVLGNFEGSRGAVQ